MYISAFVHRDMLLEITNRWLSSRLHPDDPITVTRIINYDGFVAWETLLQWIPKFIAELHPEPIHVCDLSCKKDLKDFICNGNGRTTDRIRSLVAAYQQMPEFYYVGSPMAGKLFHNRHRHMVAVCRFKRVKRIAEKANRYVSMHIFEGVKQAAAAIMKSRGIHPPAPVPLPPELLLEAEQEVMQHIRENGIQLPFRAMTLKDVLGMKLIDHGFGESGLEAAIDRMPGITIVEKQRHSGIYNAVHYVVEIRIDADDMARRFARQPDPGHYAACGLPADRLSADFEVFLATGVDSVQADLILTSYEELVESEIGRSMHEMRIFRQRQEQAYYGNIPVNIEYILEYMLSLGLSPCTHIDEIPIKIWGRYLPDTMSHIIRELHGMPGYTMIKD